MELMIPLFYCKSPEDTLSFYETVGFKVTFRQDSPYLYASVERENIRLHFAKRAKPATSLVFVTDVVPYYQTFSDALREKYGRIPTATFPRITRFQAGQTRFHLFDPSGNLLLFINTTEPEMDYSQYDGEGLSAIEQVLVNVAFLRDTYTDDKAAARVIDLALKRHPSATVVERARLLAARAELAVAMDDDERAQTLRDELTALPLSEDDRARWQAEFSAAEKLITWRAHKA